MGLFSRLKQKLFNTPDLAQQKDATSERTLKAEAALEENPMRFLANPPRQVRKAVRRHLKRKAERMIEQHPWLHGKGKKPMHMKSAVKQNRHAEKLMRIAQYRADMGGSLPSYAQSDRETRARLRAA